MAGLDLLNSTIEFGPGIFGDARVGGKADVPAGAFGDGRNFRITFRWECNGAAGESGGFPAILGGGASAIGIVNDSGVIFLNANNDVQIGSQSICDGQPHFVDVVSIVGTGSSIAIDGNVVCFSNSSLDFTAGCGFGYQNTVPGTSAYYLGEGAIVDELQTTTDTSISTSVPTGPYTGNEINQLAYYPLNDSIADASNHKTPSSKIILPDDPAIYYTPAGADVTSARARMCGNGHEIRFGWTGTLVAMSYNTANAPAGSTRFRYSIDGDPFISVDDITKVPVAVASTRSGWKSHYMRIQIETYQANINMYNDPPNVGLELLSITLSSDGEILQHPLDRRPMEWFTDSIGQCAWGNYYTSSATDLGSSPSHLAYCAMMSEALGYDIVRIGTSGAALTTTVPGTSTNMPPLLQAMNNVYQGVAKKDLDKIAAGGSMIGCNDYSQNVSSAVIQAAYEQMLEDWFTSRPNAEFFLMLVPFNQVYAAETRAAHAAYGSSKVLLVETAGYFELSPTPSTMYPAWGPSQVESGDGLHPYASAQMKATALMLADVEPRILALRASNAGSGGSSTPLPPVTVEGGTKGGVWRGVWS